MIDLAFYRRFRGFARLASFVACLVAFWPYVLFEMQDAGYGFRGLCLRLRQELELANGTPEAEIRARYSL